MFIAHTPTVRILVNIAIPGDFAVSQCGRWRLDFELMEHAVLAKKRGEISGDRNDTAKKKKIVPAGFDEAEGEQST